MSDGNLKEYEPLILGYASGKAGTPEISIQIEGLKKSGCHRVVVGEDRFLDCLSELHEGDTLVVCGLYDLTCNLPDFVTLMKAFENKGVGFCTLEEGDFVNADLSNPDTTPQIQLFEGEFS